MKGIREQDNQNTSGKSPTIITKKPWYRLFRTSKAPKVSGTDQAEMGTSPTKSITKQPPVDGASSMGKNVSIMPSVHVCDLLLDDVGSNDHRKEDADTTAALPVIPYIKLTGMGSQHGAIDAAFERKGSHGSTRANLADHTNLHG